MHELGGGKLLESLVSETLLNKNAINRISCLINIQYEVDFESFNDLSFFPYHPPLVLCGKLSLLINKQSRNRKKKLRANCPVLIWHHIFTPYSH